MKFIETQNQSDQENNAVTGGQEGVRNKEKASSSDSVNKVDVLEEDNQSLLTRREETLWELFQAIKSYGSSDSNPTKKELLQQINNFIIRGVDIAAVRDVEGVSGYGNIVNVNPLRLAVSLGLKEVVRILLEAQKVQGVGADEGAFLDGKTTMALAVEKGHVDVLTLLSSEGVGVDPTEQNPIGPLEIAAYYGNALATGVLVVNGANVNSLNTDGRTPLMTAALGGQEDVVTRLISSSKEAESLDLNKQDLAGNTALMIGITSGNVSIVNSLLSAGCDVLRVNVDGDNAMNFAAYYGNTDILETLDDYAASNEVSNNMGKTPFISAVANGQLGAVSWFLKSKSGVDMGAVMKDGWTPMMIALNIGNLDIVNTLLESDNKSYLNLDQENAEGYNAYSMAAYYAEEGDEKYREGYEKIKNSLLEIMALQSVSLEVDSTLQKDALGVEKCGNTYAAFSPRGSNKKMVFTFDQLKNSGETPKNVFEDNSKSEEDSLLVASDIDEMDKRPNLEIKPKPKPIPMPIPMPPIPPKPKPKQGNSSALIPGPSVSFPGSPGPTVSDIKIGGYSVKIKRIAREKHKKSKDHVGSDGSLHLR